MLLQLGNKAQSAFWISIASVGKCMNKYIGKALRFTNINQCCKMVDVRVYTTITYQSQQVKWFMIGFGKTNSLQKNRPAQLH